MNNFHFSESNEILGRRLDTVVNAPTVSPSPFPFTQGDRDFSEIFSYSISVGNRLIIGAIILMRLWRYHKSGVVRWSELKTKFHVLLLFTVRSLSSIWTVILFKLQILCSSSRVFFSCRSQCTRPTMFSASITTISGSVMSTFQGIYPQDKYSTRKDIFISNIMKWIMNIIHE